MPEPDRPTAWYPWSDANVTFSLRGFNNALAAAPPDNEQVKQRILRQLLAEGLKPGTSRFVRKLQLELRRHENARRRPRPEVIDTPKKKPKEDEQTRRSRQEANRVRDEEEI